MQITSIKAVLSGGVSGLGLSVAQRIINEGGSVALLDINDEKGEQVAKQLGNKAHYFTTNVTDEANVDASVGAANQAMGGINAAISCAGILGTGRVLGREAPMSLAHFNQCIQVNLIGTFNLAKTAANVMQHNKANDDGERGVIINTASVAAYEGQIGQAAYAASKGGIVGMTLPMAREFTRFGLRVMTLAPGVFHTPMVDAMPQAVQDALGASVPFPTRLGKPEEFADTVIHIIANAYLNGSVIRLDGAVRLTPK